MFKYLTTVLLALVITATHGQTDFRKGYVITNSTDTLSGSIAFHDGALAYDVCEFRPSGNQQQVNYLPGKIQGYGFIGGKFFESKTIPIDAIQKRMFLEVVVRGKVSLLKFGERFWVEKEEVGFLPLENKSTRKEVGNKTLIKYDNMHIATLNRMMFDCPEVKDDVEDIVLTKRALTNLVEAYNKCVDGGSVVYEESKPWAKPLFGIITGANVSQLQIKAAYRYDDLTGNTAWKAFVVVGPTLDLFFPRFSERFSFYTALYFIPTKYELHNQWSTQTLVHDDYLTVDIKQFKIPGGIKYTFSSKKVAPYVNCGLTLTYNVDPEVTWKDVSTEPTQTTTKDQKPFDVKAMQQGYWAGVGMITPLWRNWNGVLELRAERTNGIVNATEIATRIVNYQLMVGVRMK